MRLDTDKFREMDRKVKNHDAERRLVNRKETVVRLDLIDDELLNKPITSIDEEPITEVDFD